MNSVGEIKKIIPNQYFRPSRKKSWLTLIRVIAILLLLNSILYLSLHYLTGATQIVISSLISITLGISLVGLFVIGHDCAHYSFHDKKWVNELVGIVVFTPLLNSFFGWREGHNFHHRYTQVRKMDPDWPELLKTKQEWKKGFDLDQVTIHLGLGSPIGLFVGFWVGMLKRLFFPFLIPQMKLSTKKSILLLLQNIGCLLLSLLFIAFYYQKTSLSFFLYSYIIPSLLAATIGAMLTWLQHSHAGAHVFDLDSYDHFKAQVLSTYNVRFPNVVEYLWLDINIHLPHHVSPSIPWYYLKNSLEVIKQSNPEVVHEMPFTVKLLRKNWKAIYLHESENKKWNLSDFKY
jgi:omega-6 fatty acid desaturase (delta-12 desaturase)